MNYLLSEAEEPIRQALERLVAKDEKLLPFVSVEKVGDRNVFVQFCTKDGVLLFDVPKLKITAETTPEFGALNAVATLGLSLGVSLDERVSIFEEDQREPPRVGNIPFWKRLFT